ncbi:hypothetical protein [Lacinutrix sp. MEBiC02404]
MKKKLLLFTITLCFSICQGQDWHRLSDSIYNNILNDNIEKAEVFLELTNELIGDSKVIKDTVYADFLYRKGLVSFYKGKPSLDFFQESLTLRNKLGSKNSYKFMKLHYFIGLNYFYDKNNTLAIKHFELCSIINEENELEFNQNYNQSIYFLAFLHQKNETFNLSKQYAQTYIELNRTSAFKLYDFNYAKAYLYIDQIDTQENVLITFLNNYKTEQLDNSSLLLKILVELTMYYYGNENYVNAIKYGEEALDTNTKLQLNELSEQELMYTLLIHSYNQIGDNINEEKYKQLKYKYFPNVDDIDYYEELNKLIYASDYNAFINQFNIYETILKTEQNYGELLSIYTLSITLFERSVLYDKKTIEGQLNFLKLYRSELSEEDKILFDLLLAEFSFFTQDFLTTLKLCNRNLGRAIDEYKLLFLKLKTISEHMLRLPNAQESAYETVEYARLLYGNNNPQILPYLILPLIINVYGNDNRTTAIATEALQVIYANNLKYTDIAAQLWGY